MKRMVLLLCRMQAYQSLRRQLYVSVVGTFACCVVLLVGPYLPYSVESSVQRSLFQTSWNELERDLVQAEVSFMAELVYRRMDEFHGLCSDASFLLCPFMPFYRPYLFARPFW